MPPIHECDQNIQNAGVQKNHSPAQRECLLAVAARGVGSETCKLQTGDLYPRLVVAVEEALKGQKTGDSQCDVAIAESDVGARVDLEWIRACMQ